MALNLGVKDSKVLRQEEIQVEGAGLNLKVEILSDLPDPQVIRVRGFLAASEAAELEAVVLDQRDLVLASYRASRTAWLDDKDSDLLAEISRKVQARVWRAAGKSGVELKLRIEAFTGLSLQSAEDFQVAYYHSKEAGHYAPHFDWGIETQLAEDFGSFRDGQGAAKSRGPRLATFLIYLSDVPGGGATTFVRENLTFRPEAVQTSLVHLAAGQCSCSSAVMELHRRVPAELWCVTYSELFTFDAEHGPNLYVVNEHFVKPKTLAVGGMIHQLIICISGAICLPWWSTPYDASLGAMASFLHHFLPVAVQLFNTLCIYHLQLQVLEIQQLMDQANYLSCQTVQEAQCTNPTDEERIRSAIAGAEDDVDVAIRVLMLAGAYTKSLRHAYESGEETKGNEDIRGAGILNLKAKATIGGVLWCMAGLDGTTRFDRRGIATTQMQRDWAFVTVLSAFLVAVVMPLWLRKTRSGPDWIRRTLGLKPFRYLSLPWSASWVP
eukprot:g7280.t1